MYKIQRYQFTFVTRPKTHETIAKLDIKNFNRYKKNIQKLFTFEHHLNNRANIHLVCLVISNYYKGFVITFLLWKFAKDEVFV